MAPAIQTATQNLTYPLYACDFDPQDANRLVVGGGGGANRSGVANKISVLDASHLDSLQVVSELDLSREEDNVASLAVGPRRRNSIVLFTGINSSPTDVKKGKNEHFRVFAVDPSSRAKPNPKITELSRTAMLSYTETDAYQRVLRISPAFPDKPQIGAVATGLATPPQIAIFDVPTGGAAPKARGRLELAKDPEDLDIIQTGEDEYQLVYCDNYEIFRVTIGKKSVSDPHCVFTMPHDEDPRPSFRSLRYLTPTFVLAAANLPNGRGIVLHGFRLPTADAGSEAKARLAISAKLPKTKNTKKATGMAVRNLSPPSSPTAKYGDTQFAIAVSGSDSSITLYKLDHQAVGDVELLANLHPVTTIESVHPGAPISGLVFSHFIPPKTPTMRVLQLKLASVGSIANSCVVHSLPLQRLPDKTSAAARRAGPPRQPRYVLALKSQGPSSRGLIITLGLIALLLAILGQSLLEVRGAPSIIGARRVVPTSWHADYAANAVNTKHFLSDYLVGTKLAHHDKVVVLDVDDDAEEIRFDTHDEKLHGPAVEWHELPAEQKDAWKEKLQRAGHWGEQMGEAVFKGVLFGEIAGAVGNAVRQGL
ncbi:hypothetical protein B0T16DRAFT_412407 [Cercophora newfieldiana]|uniref:Guanine nucleotide-exchange factor SEC12 n=1 Tax=Cercophora newfieldiana TaxID=92897 RepID=A0AA39Y4Q7_9PEZI|nr:hypothetical protein B0T16DRAFT_412407 [Cercophora newfieldiana]